MSIFLRHPFAGIVSLAITLDAIALLLAATFAWFLTGAPYSPTVYALGSGVHRVLRVDCVRTGRVKLHDRSHPSSEGVFEVSESGLPHVGRWRRRPSGRGTPCPAG